MMPEDERGCTYDSTEEIPWDHDNGYGEWTDAELEDEEEGE